MTDKKTPADPYADLSVDELRTIAHDRDIDLEGVDDADVLAKLQLADEAEDTDDADDDEVDTSLDDTLDARQKLRAAKAEFGKARERFAKAQEKWAAARREFTSGIAGGGQ